MYCVSYFTGKLNFQPFYPLKAYDGNPKPKKMNGASFITPGISGTTPKQGEFKKGGHGGGARKGDSYFHLLLYFPAAPSPFFIPPRPACFFVGEISFPGGVHDGN